MHDVGLLLSGCRADVGWIAIRYQQATEQLVSALLVLSKASAEWQLTCPNHVKCGDRWVMTHLFHKHDCAI